MNTRCKPGDLAIVIRALETPEMLGRIVKVERLAVAGEVFSSVCGRSFCTPSVSESVLWVVSSNRAMPAPIPQKGCTLMAYERIFKDVCLRPITGLPIDEETHEDLKVEA
jgi:hypothetical protein